MNVKYGVVSAVLALMLVTGMTTVAKGHGWRGGCAKHSWMTGNCACGGCRGMCPGMCPGMPGPEMWGQGAAPWNTPPSEPLSTADVEQMVQSWLTWTGNPNLQMGEVKEKDSDVIEAGIVTKDGSLVQRLVVDRRTGAMQPGY